VLAGFPLDIHWRPEYNSDMNKMQRASLAEAKFIGVAFAHLWEVAKPFHHAQGYDFVIRRPGEPWSTVQVKHAYAGRDGRRRPTREVSLRRCNEKGSRPYRDGEFDWLFVVDGDQCWLIPWLAIREIRSNITIGSTKYMSFLL